MTWSLVVGAAVFTPQVSAQSPIDFSRQIRPLLSNNCFQCHGPDEHSREADLRLDLRDAALDPDLAVVVPGRPTESALIERITSDDPDLVMPPPGSGKELTPDQIALLESWIDQGATWSVHWAFETPQRPIVPDVASSDWVANPIDAYVLAKLQQSGLTPSPPADRTTLIRRLYLDLTGLPPTPEQVDTFLADQRPEAYRELVESLLESPHYGERWGRVWLDAARYADSDGFEKDKPRQVWFYRDWVINALNSDMPYDEFIIKQVAGDLLPNASQSDRVATGFLRNSMINEEGGVDPEQFRMEAMFDRMDAIGKAVLGLTVQCSQCHSHKYDPLSQADYYRMFAMINNCHEAQITVYTPEQQMQREQVDGQLQLLREKLKADHPNWREDLSQWADQLRARPATRWQTLELTFDDKTIGGQKFLPQDDGSYLAQSYAPTKFRPQMTATLPPGKVTAIRLELLTDPNLPQGGPGRSLWGTAALTEFEMEVGYGESPGSFERVEFAGALADRNPGKAPLASIYYDKTDKERVTGPVQYALDGDDLTAWGTDLGPGRRNESRVAVFRLAEPIESDQPIQLVIYLKQMHGGWNSDDNQTHNLGRFRLSASEELSAQDAPLPPIVEQLLEVDSLEWNDAQWDRMFDEYRRSLPDSDDWNQRFEEAWSNYPEGTSQLVLMEREVRRPTYLLDRGDFLKPVQEVQPGVPGFLHDLPTDKSPTRLDFARWLVDPRSPTTARSIVNRIWQAYYGNGLVASSEDLGSQGEAPSHPQLLDWLAVELMEQNWSLKHLHRLIVSSATYRQASSVSQELLEIDPYNRLFARGARFRLPAESIRDVALSASGLLNEKVGGPSVFPPAPDFLFVPPASYGPKTWDESTDAARYRRAIYTFRFRSVPYPMLQTFDAPNADLACVRRPRSNTPLQALTSLNEPLFLECAQSLGTIGQSAAENDSERLAEMFRRCLARRPDDQELGELTSLLNDFRQTLKRTWSESDETGRKALVELSGGSQTDLMGSGEAEVEVASWTLVARVLLNLDETITRE